MFGYTLDLCVVEFRKGKNKGLKSGEAWKSLWIPVSLVSLGCKTLFNISPSLLLSLLFLLLILYFHLRIHLLNPLQYQVWYLQTHDGLSYSNVICLIKKLLKHSVLDVFSIFQKRAPNIRERTPNIVIFGMIVLRKIVPCCRKGLILNPPSLFIRKQLYHNRR